MYMIFSKRSFDNTVSLLTGSNDFEGEMGQARSKVRLSYRVFDISPVVSIIRTLEAKRYNVNQHPAMGHYEEMTDSFCRLMSSY